MMELVELQQLDQCDNQRRLPQKQRNQPFYNIGFCLCEVSFRGKAGQVGRQQFVGDVSRHERPFVAIGLANIGRNRVFGNPHASTDNFGKKDELQ